jgi:hypothetical protein
VRSLAAFSSNPVFVADVALPGDPIFRPVANLRPEVILQFFFPSIPG